MILATLSGNGTTLWLSMRGASSGHWWAPGIREFDMPKWGTAYEWGGAVTLEFGGMSIFPQTLIDAETWPPPLTWSVVVEYMPDGGVYGTDNQTLIEGSLRRDGFSFESVRYNFYENTGLEYNIAGGTAWNTNLQSFVTWMCDPTRLNLSTDFTASSRASAVTINHQLPTDDNRQAIGVMSDALAFYSHCFYIRGGTCYVVDMLAENGSRDLSEFDFFPPEYMDTEPIQYVSNTDDEWTYPTGEFSSGQMDGNQIDVTPFHPDNGTTIEAAYDDIITIIQKPRIRIGVPLTGDLPVPGEKIEWSDSRFKGNIVASILAREISYDFSPTDGGLRAIIEGEGTIAAGFEAYMTDDGAGGFEAYMVDDGAAGYEEYMTRVAA
jgi:hypothetical protein